MIAKEELEAYTTYRDRYQVEKDYLQDLLLYSICSDTRYGLVFKGGTAIAKFYGSDRFSEDLDFTGAIEGDSARALIDRAMASIQYDAAYKDEPHINEHGTLTAAISIQGPRYNGKPSTIQQVLFEINTNAKLVEKAVPAPRNPIYADARNYVALVMDRREILSEKVRAIMSKGRRHRERDLYDMYYLFGKGTAVEESTVLKKMHESGIGFSKKALLESIGSVRATWKALEPFVQHRLEEYSHVSESVIEALERHRVL